MALNPPRGFVANDILSEFRQLEAQDGRPEHLEDSRLVGTDHVRGGDVGDVAHPQVPQGGQQQIEVLDFVLS